MTEYSIQQQIQDIREAMNTAAQSKESALKFLIDAGIVEPKDVKKSSYPRTDKKNK